MTALGFIPAAVIMMTSFYSYRGGDGNFASSFWLTANAFKSSNYWFNLVYDVIYHDAGI